jgi:hypothetical protein
MDELAEYFMVGEWPEKMVRDEFLRKYLGDHRSRLGARIPLEQSMGEPLIDEIPSETTPAERRLLYLLFRHWWSGQGHVFEVGPFLGGTTRAMALGMEANPRRRADARLYTADKFSDYYKPEDLEGYLKPLFERGVLTAEDREAIGTKGRFRQVFDRIHQRQPYHAFLEVMDGVLPDLPEHQASGGAFLNLAPIAPVDAFFIDGCKSWYGTKYMLREAARCAAPNALYIFQDYGMYTCFWVPVCLQLLRENFRLVAYADCTYVWAATQPLTVEQVDAAIPDRAESLSRDELVRVFAGLEAAARRREDRRAIVAYPLQYAAARAYQGDLEEARRHIEALQARPEALGYEDLIARVRRMPTYRPILRDPGWENIYLD